MAGIFTDLLAEPEALKGIFRYSNPMIRKQRKRTLPLILLGALVGPPCVSAEAADPQVLVTVGDLAVTSAQLESTIASSPFAVQFNTMEQDEQAALRGALLQRLVASRLLRLEAQRIGLDQDPAFLEEMERYRQGLLYRAYLDDLRARVVIPDDVQARLDEQYADDADARTAAESAYRVDRYRTVKLLTLDQLRERYELRLHEERIASGIPQDTLLAEGDGIQITYADILRGVEDPPDSPEWIEQRVRHLAEFQLFAKVAEDHGLDVSERLEAFREERLPALLLERKEGEWLPDDQPLHAYFEAHPELGKLLTRWHIGQIVLATQAEAEAMRQRILGGESLFALAGKYSIDPHGRERKGDLGWVREGRGMPEIERVITGLEDGAVSPVIETPLGFHLVTIIERSPGEERPFHLVRDKVRQRFLADRLTEYLGGLEAQYQVAWNLIQPTDDRQ